MKTVYVFLLLCLNYTIEAGPANQIYHRRSGHKSEQVLEFNEFQREKEDDDPDEELLRRKRSHILGPDGRSLSHDTPEGRGEKEENGPCAHSKPSEESLWGPPPPFVIDYKPLFPDGIFYNLGNVEVTPNPSKEGIFGDFIRTMVPPHIIPIDREHKPLILESAKPQESENSKIIEQQNTTEKKPERTDVTNQQSNVPEKESIDPPPFCC